MNDLNLQQIFKLLDTLPNPVTLNKQVFDENGEEYDEIVYVNTSFLNTIGYTTEDIPSDRVWFTKAYPNPEYQDYISTEWFNAVDKCKKENTDLIGFSAKITCKSNNERWFNVTTQLSYPIADQYRTIVFLETDAPKKIKLDLDNKSLQLKRKEILIKTIMNTVATRIFWKDLNGVYLGCNRAFLEDAQLNDDSEIIGKTDYDMVWKSDAKRYIDDDKEVQSSGIPKINYIEEQPHEDGETTILSTSKVPLKNNANETIGILGTYADITAEYKSNAELKKQEELLIFQSRQAAMGEMVSMIAHQWKHPLSTIASITANVTINQVLEINQKDTIEKNMKSIDEQIKYLSHTISDFTNFFKSNKNKSEIKIDKPIDAALSIINHLLIKNSIEVKKNYDSKKTFFTYDKELQQVFINIVKNAADVLIERNIKNTFIEISTYDDNKFVYVDITDKAGGINQSIIGNIFEPYISTKNEDSGTGLGLYICKTIIENHLNGKLEASNIDDGAKFTIKLPLSI